MRRRTLLAASTLLAAPAIVRAQGTNGVALVIGNSKYKWEASLPNVKRDAPDIAKAFQALGLKTELVQDTSRDAMLAAVEKFAAAARGANLAAFYYAGHGASWEKDTYLVPEDADLSNPGTVKALLPVNAVSAAVKDAKNRLMIFDNCRNNPADGWRQRAAADSSFIDSAEVTAASLHGPRTLVLFSTAPGRVALDGPPGENSPFAASVLRQLEESTIDLSTLPARLRRDVLLATEGRQVIWDQNTYDAPFTLDGPRNRPRARAVAASLDPSRIVELPHTYAFARTKRLALPAGLVCIRPPPGAPHGGKVGAFETTTRVAVGGAGQTALAYSLEPFLLIVLSIEGEQEAQALMSTRTFWNNGGFFWRFLPVKLSGNELEFKAQAVGYMEGSSSFFRWSDDNTGRYVILRTGGWTSMRDEKFTRLDG